MTASEKNILRIMPKLNSRRVDMLLEDVIGCRWTISVLRAVAGGVNRPGALERHIEGISAKVLTDRLRHFTRAGLFERLPYPEIPPRVEYRLTPFGKKFLRLLKEVEKLQAELNEEINPQPVAKRLDNVARVVELNDKRRSPLGHHQMG